MNARIDHAIRGLPALLLVVAALAPTAAAGVATPHQLPLQGKATDGSGAVLASGDLAVRIYDAPTAGALVYDSAAEFSGSIADGIFDVLLGAATSLDLDNTQLYYLEIDVDANEVIGDANGGRYAFYPGGGSHARTDLADRLTALEIELGITREPGGTTGPVSTPTRFSGNSASYKLRHGLLGTGAAADAGASYKLAANLLLQPAGPYTAAARHLYLGPYYLMPDEAQAVPGEEAGTPSAFRLYACSPNPFTRATRIRFDLPAPEPVMAQVYTIDGRLEATLHNGVLPAGRHEVTWHGLDDRGVTSASGVYFLRFRRQSGDETRRLILLE
jgi:hypothetical protein